MNTLFADKAEPLNIIARRLNTFAFLLIFKDKDTKEFINLTGAIVAMHFTQGGRTLLKLDNSKGLSINANGELLVNLPFEEFTIPKGEYEYDMPIILDGVKETYLEGVVTVKEQRSR